MPRGLVLKLRTVKRDGSVLEPELVEGKPTVTMPHPDVGDYIETACRPTPLRASSSSPARRTARSTGTSW